MKLCVLLEGGIEVLPDDLPLFELDGPRDQRFTITVADFLDRLTIEEEE